MVYKTCCEFNPFLTYKSVFKDFRNIFTTPSTIRFNLREVTKIRAFTYLRIKVRVVPLTLCCRWSWSTMSNITDAGSRLKSPSAVKLTIRRACEKSLTSTLKFESSSAYLTGYSNLSDIKSKFSLIAGHSVRGCLHWPLNWRWNDVSKTKTASMTGAVSEASSAVVIWVLPARHDTSVSSMTSPWFGLLFLIRLNLSQTKSYASEIFCWASERMSVRGGTLTSLNDVMTSDGNWASIHDIPVVLEFATLRPFWRSRNEDLLPI